MSKSCYALLLAATLLGGCAVAPEFESEDFGSRHTVRATSVAEGREAAVTYCLRSERNAYLTGESVVDRGDRLTYRLRFTCEGYSPNLYRGGD